VFFTRNEWGDGADIARAKKLGLVGWVRNNPDESVEGAASGPTSQMDEL
jgi:acylphosphatase